MKDDRHESMRKKEKACFFFPSDVSDHILTEALQFKPDGYFLLRQSRTYAGVISISIKDGNRVIQSRYIFDDGHWVPFTTGQERVGNTDRETGNSQCEQLLDLIESQRWGRVTVKREHLVLPEPVPFQYTLKYPSFLKWEEQNECVNEKYTSSCDDQRGAESRKSDSVVRFLDEISVKETNRSETDDYDTSQIQTDHRIYL